MKIPFKIFVFTVLYFTLSACSTINVNNAYVRSEAIEPSKNIANRMGVGDVNSDFSMVSKSSLKQVFQKTLAGNNYLTKGFQPDFSIGVNLLEGDLTPGFSNSATVKIQYTLSHYGVDGILFKQTYVTDASTGNNLFTRQAKNANTDNGRSADLFPVITDGKKRYVNVSDYRKNDFNLGLPEPGTPTSSNDGEDRDRYVIEAALRKNFVVFLKDINSEFVPPKPVRVVVPPKKILKPASKPSVPAKKAVEPAKEETKTPANNTKAPVKKPETSSKSEVKSDKDATKPSPKNSEASSKGTEPSTKNEVKSDKVTDKTTTNIVPDIKTTETKTKSATDADKGTQTPAPKSAESK